MTKPSSDETNENATVDRRRQSISAREFGVAAATFLVLAIGLWWQIWSGHPTTMTTCGCGDAARFAWFFEWPAFALTHGHSPLFSAWMLHPTGINLLDDTSVLGLGLFLAPLTWMAGPVASMNVALLLAPMLSATTCFVMVRRFGAERWAAWFAGLLFGFSPFMLTELALNQINIAFLGIVPLLVILLDEILVVQRWRPRNAGLLLAMLVVVQFFIGIELLVIVGVVTSVALVVLAVHGRRSDAARRRARRRRSGAGLAWAGVTSGVVLCYPVWYFFFGSAHLSGPIWGGAPLAVYGTSVTGFVNPLVMVAFRQSMLNFGGYQGLALPGFGYVGFGLLLLGVACAVVSWRRPIVRLATVMAVISAWLSFDPHGAIVTPWSFLDRLPVLSNVAELRFVAVTMLCLAVILGIGLGDLAKFLGRSLPATGGRVGTMALVVLALLPTLVAMWPNLPLTARSVAVPAWFRSVAATTTSSRVVLTYPFPSSGIQSSLAWQAVDGMAWAQAGGGGPSAIPSRAAPYVHAATVLDEGSLGLGPLPAIDEANVSAVRSALMAWGVTTLVVPIDRDLPRYAQGRSRTWAIAFLTAVEGVGPHLTHTALVWESVARTRAPHLSFDATAASACVAVPVQSVSSCVLRLLS